MRGWCCGAVVGALFEQPEDADHGFTVFEWYRADLDGDACAGGGEQTPVASVAGVVPSTFWASSSAARGGLSARCRSDRVVKWRPRTLPMSRSAAAFEASGRLSGVARGRLQLGTATFLQGLLDVTADFQASGSRHEKLWLIRAGDERRLRVGRSSCDWFRSLARAR